VDSGTPDAGISRVFSAWKTLSKATGPRWYSVTRDDSDLTKPPVFTPLDGVIGYKSADTETIESRTRVALTLEQEIEKSYAAYVADFGVWDWHRQALPDARRLMVGQAVEYGAFSDCKVVALHEDGHAVTLAYTRTARYSTGREREVRTVYWVSVLAKEHITAPRMCHPPRYAGLQPLSGVLGALVTRVWQQGLNDHPDYQREYVWSPDDEARFLDSVFQGKALGMFIFLSYRHPKPEEIFDGKQRLTTLLRLVTGKIAYKGVWWHQLQPQDRRQVEDRTVPHLTIPGGAFTRGELLQIFLDVNTSGVPQTEAHLVKVKELLAQELKAPETRDLEM
jgi:hypothetical protein